MLGLTRPLPSLLPPPPPPPDPSPGSEAVLPQQVGLPHVLPLGKPLGDLDLAEVLNALFQLLLHRHLLLGRPLLAAAGVAGAGRERAQQVALSPLLGLLEHGDGALLQRPVQRLHVGVRVRLAADGATDDGALGGAGFRLALGAGGGELVKGGAALALAVALVVLAAAVARRGGPARRATCKETELTLESTTLRHLGPIPRQEKNEMLTQRERQITQAGGKKSK